MKNTSQKKRFFNLAALAAIAGIREVIVRQQIGAVIPKGGGAVAGLGVARHVRARADSTSEPYSIIDGEVWVDAGLSQDGCQQVKNLRTGEIRKYKCGSHSATPAYSKPYKDSSILDIRKQAMSLLKSMDKIFGNSLDIHQKTEILIEFVRLIENKYGDDMETFKKYLNMKTFLSTKQNSDGLSQGQIFSMMRPMLPASISDAQLNIMIERITNRYSVVKSSAPVSSQANSDIRNVIIETLGFAQALFRATDLQAAFEKLRSQGYSFTPGSNNPLGLQSIERAGVGNKNVINAWVKSAYGRERLKAQPYRSKPGQAPVTPPQMRPDLYPPAYSPATQGSLDPVGDESKRIHANDAWNAYIDQLSHSAATGGYVTGGVVDQQMPPPPLDSEPPPTQTQPPQPQIPFNLVGLDGLGDVDTSSPEYANWYYSTYMPWYQAQQAARYAAVQYQPGYQYQQPYGYGQQQPYASNPQACAGQGGYWDAFSNQCTSRVGVANQPAAVTPPNVIGTPAQQAMNALTAQGWTPRVSRNGYQRYTLNYDYNPRRVNLEIDNGYVSNVTVG